MYEPKTLDEFISQDNIVEQVKTVLEASTTLDIPCPHMIFYGGAGLGKTALGKIIATEMKSKMIYCIGNTLNPERELVLLSFKDVLFIDEIHRVKPSMEEILYNPMDNWTLFLPNGIYDKGIPVYPFTLIGATTLLGKVSKPLRDRCVLNLHFQPYKEDDLSKILVQACINNDILIDPVATELIAQMSRGTPRIALKILLMADNVRINNNENSIMPDTVERTKELLQIESDGLSIDDIKYMELLFECNRPIGQQAIAITLGVDTRTVSDVIEPFLMENGYVMLTDRGRRLTRKGVERIRNGN
jgi:Holliday junction DNA helicase RuvB